ncbi:tyrosine-type recombinase/integrase [Actinocatenispora sera]|uniref:Site-specific integrase n=1 Tax=Actinocatenispora sera TaxID=390989 RepID=A0A810L6K0_9ACTN|nr:tyrosine-type recombinase/integrase [Actinocatenispora sera]BCJ30535.1 site-specific integrase [Actinocatenispora sera]
MSGPGKRRRNGEGTIYQRKDGRWVAELYYPQPDGTRRRKPVYGKTRTEVEDKLAELRKHAQQGVPLASGTLTLNAYLTEWLTEVVSKRVRPNTLETYRIMVEQYLLPGIGRRKLGKLNVREVRQFLDGLAKRGTGARTVQYVHTTLRVALEDAMREEIISRNVARLVRVPAPPKQERQPLTVEQVKALLRHTRDYRLYALFVVLALLGLRRSEALALRWDDVDLTNGVLRVSASLQRTVAGLERLPTKTRRSVRTVPLPALVLRALRDHWYQTLVERIDLDDRHPDSGYVFTTSIGTPIDPRNCSRLFREMCTDAGLPTVRLHDLRHGCASVLLQLAVPPRTVMEILGHSTLEMTMNTYAHVSLDDKRSALDKIGAVMADES